MQKIINSVLGLIHIDRMQTFTAISTYPLLSEESWEIIVDGFSNLHDGIAKERRAMEKLWKEREKQLEKVLNNAVGFYGSIKGIAGNAVPVLPLLELDADTALEEA